jgi:hypothetical protein
MEDINTNPIDNYSQEHIKQLIQDRMREMTPQERLDALSDAVSRMKSHSIVLGQFFTRSSTKQAAIAGMDTEISNLTTLWALVKADLQEVEV